MFNYVRPHRWQPTRLCHPLDSPGKNTGVGCHFLLQCVKVKSESEVTHRVRLIATPWTAAYQAPLSMGFSRQEYWSGLPLLSSRNVIKSTIKFSSVQSLSRVRLSATTWTAAYQAPASMGFSRQEYWSGVPWPSKF